MHHVNVLKQRLSPPFSEFCVTGTKLCLDFVGKFSVLVLFKLLHKFLEIKLTAMANNCYGLADELPQTISA